MLSNIFVVGDVHGEIRQLEKLLEKWNPEEQQLLFIGDLGDRGENPKECFLLVKQLVEEKGAICLRGNHEENFLLFLEEPELYAANFAMNGGYKTLQTLLGEQTIETHSPDQVARLVKERYADLITFIKKLPLYWESGKYLFVHAGVDLGLPDWHDTDPQDFIWIREPFHRGKNTTGKTIVFGHTPTFLLHGDMQDSSLWQQDNKIGIDGGAVYGGTLHGLVFGPEGIKEHYGVHKDPEGRISLEEYDSRGIEHDSERGWKKRLWKARKTDQNNKKSE